MNPASPTSPSPTRSRLRRAGALAAALALAGGGLAACSGSSPSGDATAQITGCADLDGVTGLSGHKVTVATSFTGVEAERFDQSLGRFESCTGIDVVQKGSDSLESDMRALVDDAGASASASATASAEATTAESGVDVAVLPQPGLVEDLADAGLLTALPDPVNANIEAGWDRSWAEVGTVDGTAYAIPLQASVKSMVWYSPTAFKAAGYRVPTTWTDLVALTEQIVKDRPDGDVTPWCLGLADGASSGWGVSDWLEDAMLSTEGPGAYDKWASHEVALDDTIGVQALDAVGSLVLADGHVEGGREGSLRTTVNRAAADLVAGRCLMLHGSSSLESLLPAGTAVTDAEGADAVDVEASGEAVAPADPTASASSTATATATSSSDAVPTGDAVSAFSLPSDDENTSPLLVGGDYAVALSNSTADEKAVEAVLDYLSSSEWSQTRVQLGGVATANRGVDASTIRSAVTRRATEQLQSRQSVIRMDASDSMPSQVGTDALWGALTKYVSGELTSNQALAEAEEAWPKDDAGVASSDGAESTATPTADDEH